MRALASPDRTIGQPRPNRDAETGRYMAAAIDVITLEGSLIKEITGFILPGIFPQFGLPAEHTP